MDGPSDVEIGKNIVTTKPSWKDWGDNDEIEGWYAEELDRKSWEIDNDFRDEHGALGFRLGQILKAKGQVAFLDAGCGTGRALYEYKQELLQGGKWSNVVEDLVLPNQEDRPEVVTAVGVNDRDYRDLSMHSRAREGIKSGFIDYRVGDLATIQLPSDSFDVAWAHEVLLHNDPGKSAIIIANLIPTLRPGGIFWFNMHPNQFQDSKFGQLMDFLQRQNIDIKSGTIRQSFGRGITGLGARQEGDQRTIARLTLPGNPKNARLAADATKVYYETASKGQK